MKISKEIRIGLLVTFSIAALFWGINFLKGRKLFSSENTYYTNYSRIDNLQESAPVYINGFKVGMVEKIELNKENLSSIEVTLLIDNQIRIPKGSSAQIYSSDLMGTRAIRIILADNKEFLNDEESLNAEIERDLKEEVSLQIVPLKKSAEDLMKETQDVMEVIKSVFNEKTRENLKNSFASIQNTIKNVENTTFKLDTLISTEERRLRNILYNIDYITTNLKNNSGNLNRIIKNFTEISDTLAKANFVQVINNTASTLDQVNSLLEKAKKGEGTIGALFSSDTLYHNVEKTVKSLDELLIDLKANPKRYVKFSVF